MPRLQGQMIVMKCRSTQILWGLWSLLECFSLDLVKIDGLGKHKRIFHLNLHQEVGVGFKDRGRSRGGCRGCATSPLPAPLR